MILNKKKFFTEITKAVIKLIIAGVLIGVLKKYDAIIAGILILKIIHNIYKDILKPKTNKNLFLFYNINHKKIKLS